MQFGRKENGVRLIDADALLMNMNLAIAILEGTMKNLGLQDDAECQMELRRADRTARTALDSLYGKDATQHG